MIRCVRRATHWRLFLIDQTAQDLSLAWRPSAGPKARADVLDVCEQSAQ